ncbi:hypothetical protein KSP40_PGU009011 [Platanthera guangdongensis]|uniref:Translation initiation factor 5A C-terminal domain-containing protein n=1 Tax=Platanthera guangdongensis TaxID=2320717 RepID=A0ABR2MYT0_9ASPA
MPLEPLQRHALLAVQLVEAVPHVNRTDYQLIDIAEDGFLSLLTENGNTKDDLKLPTDESLLAQFCGSQFVNGGDPVAGQRTDISSVLVSNAVWDSEQGSSDGLQVLSIGWLHGGVGVGYWTELRISLPELYDGFCLLARDLHRFEFKDDTVSAIIRDSSSITTIVWNTQIILEASTISQSFSFSELSSKVNVTEAETEEALAIMLSSGKKAADINKSDLPEVFGFLAVVVGKVIMCKMAIHISITEDQLKLMVVIVLEKDFNWGKLLIKSLIEKIGFATIHFGRIPSIIPSRSFFHFEWCRFTWKKLHVIPSFFKEGEKFFRSNPTSPISLSYESSCCNRQIHDIPPQNTTLSSSPYHSIQINSKLSTFW